MVVVDLGGGGAEPLSLGEAKTWCRIERSDEDALLVSLVKAARELVERETRLVLVKRAFRLALEAVPPDRRIAAPRRPVGGIVAVTVFGMDGTATVVGASAVSMDRASGGETFAVSAEAAAAAIGGIEIEFTAGYEANAVPEALKLALKRIVAASYEVRSVVAADMQPGLVPKSARDLIAPFRGARL